METCTLTVCFCTSWGLMSTIKNPVSTRCRERCQTKAINSIHEGVPCQSADAFSTTVFRVSAKNLFLLSQAAVTDTPSLRWSLLCFVAAKSKFPLQMLPLLFLPVFVSWFNPSQQELLQSVSLGPRIRCQGEWEGQYKSSLI